MPPRAPARAQSRNEPAKLSPQILEHAGAAAMLEQLMLADASDDGEANSPLHYASHQGHLPVVDVLLGFVSRAGTNLATVVDARNLHGMTPLFYAAQQGRPRVVARLLRSGATLSLREASNRFTPFDLAMSATVMTSDPPYPPVPYEDPVVPTLRASPGIPELRRWFASSGEAQSLLPYFTAIVGHGFSSISALRVASAMSD